MQLKKRFTGQSYSGCKFIPKLLTSVLLNQGQILYQPGNLLPLQSFSLHLSLDKLSPGIDYALMREPGGF